ncbi:MAG: hypothetical protein ACKOSQ_02280 [Planctomycetaceae bacterium]
MSGPAAPRPPALLLPLAHERLRRGAKRLCRPWWIARLRRRNLHDHEPLTDPRGNGPVVSLTSHAARIEEVFLAVESIGRGRLKPSRLTLWLAADLVATRLPAPLQRQQGRGLEVLPCADVGPHTKYFPLVMSPGGCERPLVTADDDQLYPRYWLARLHRAHKSEPGLVHCFRAHRIGFGPDGRLRPYREWTSCRGTVPSALNFATGVSGVSLPVAMLRALRDRGAAFLQCCPRADDVWLHAVALREGIAVRQLGVLPRAFYEIPGTRPQGLSRANVGGGENDRQIAQTYTADDRDRLRALVERPTRACPSSPTDGRL